ncbi:MAG: hypothetical protein HY423_12175 [Candidatus Lambdaproteobacteria bacterium]|nr:hypothetical protein [Candidatus Lambdaproteobacteria bacterium]
MPRILRNYLISFALIGLFFLAVKLINHVVAERMAARPGAGQTVRPETAPPVRGQPATAPAPGSGAPGSGAPGR